MRRPVRLTSDFFDSLDASLPAERREGVPSRRDFEVRSLTTIVEAFAGGWDDMLQLVDGRDDYRTWQNWSDLGLYFSVDGQLAPDGAIELIGVKIEVAQWPEDEPADEG